MSEFDISIIQFLNSYVGQSPNFDAGVVHLTVNYLFKMTPMILLLWGFWFIRDDNREQRRKAVALAFIGAFLAMATIRALAIFLPFRARPIHNHDLTIQIPYPMESHWLDGWSSLPSDHAGLAFALAIGVYLIHRRWGIVMLLHALIVVCLPRAYLGFHYPTDLILGAAIGTLCAWLTIRVFPLGFVISRIMRFERVQPAIFYILFFFMAAQMIEMFDSTRNLARNVLRPMSKIILQQALPGSPGNEPTKTTEIKK